MASDLGYEDTFKMAAMMSYVDCGLHRHPFLWCQQHVVHRLETEPLRLLDHVHGTVYVSSSLTARHLSPSRNISRLIYLVNLF